MSSENGHGTLIIRDVKEADQGAYSCEAINAKGMVFGIPDGVLSLKPSRGNVRPAIQYLCRRTKLSTSFQQTVPKECNSPEEAANPGETCGELCQPELSQSCIVNFWMDFILSNF